jgi:hypothetical protein
MLLLMTGCGATSGYESEQQRLERYRRYAGAPVDHIGSLYNSGGLTAIGPQDALFWADDRKPYLITINQPCENLRFADAIGLTHNESSDSIYSRFDSLIVKGLKCTIAEIRPVDYERMKRDKRVTDTPPAKRE